MRTETIEATIEAWTKDPEKALGAPVVTARADESQAVIQAGFTWRADLPVTIQSPDGDTGVKQDRRGVAAAVPDLPGSRQAHRRGRTVPGWLSRAR